MGRDSVFLYVFLLVNVCLLIGVFISVSKIDGESSGGSFADSPLGRVSQAVASERQANAQEPLDEPTHGSRVGAGQEGKIAGDKADSPPVTFPSPPPTPAPTSPLSFSVLRPIEFGIPTEKLPLRRPVVFIQSTLDPGVHARFLQAPMFTCAKTKLESFGLSQQVDYPKSATTHFYHEGYLHALPTSAQVWSRNPRSGKNFSKHAAGDFLRAYYEALRRVNNATFSRLQRKLYANALLRRPEAPNNDTCGMVSDWISRGMHFADISVQMHWGSQISKPELFWHSDAENSLLHLGLSIKGTRLLHSMRAITPTGAVREVLAPQQAGAAYLASSTLMNHAPSYPATSFEDRIIALQARFLYSTEELKFFRAQATPASWAALSAILAEVLSTSELHQPSIADVDAVISERQAISSTK